MTVLNYAKNRIALLIGGSSTAVPGYMLIGSGSGTVALTQGSLFNGVDGQAVTTISYPSNYKIKFQGDWNSVEMSGIQLREFGISTGSTPTGSVWTRTNIPAITFQGSNELRIEETITVL